MSQSYRKIYINSKRLACSKIEDKGWLGAIFNKPNIRTGSVF